MSAVFFVEPKRHGLDRRVFRRMGCGALEWAHYADWARNPARARYYGSALSHVPEGCEKISIG